MALPAGLAPEDFNYLDPSNRYWSYLKGLASAEAFRGSLDNIVAYRDPTKTDLLGDSGGFQYGKGSGEVSKWTGLTTEAAVLAAWRDSNLVEKIVDWIELYGSAGLSLDLPLWSARAANAGSPFHLCSEKALRDLSMDNVRYLINRRNAGRLKKKYLNVLQGDKEREEVAWYNEARHYRLDGWSLAGGVGTDGGPYRIIRRLLILRDDKLLGGGLNWVHLLKQTQPRWAPVLTAIQRGFQISLGEDEFKITYDSSTPYGQAGEFTKFVARPSLGASITGWHFKYHKFPTTFSAANDNVPRALNAVTCTGPLCEMCRATGIHLKAPLLSPIAQFLTIQDLLEKKGNFVERRGGVLADELLINHNVFTVVEGIIRANEAIFGLKPDAPQQLVDAVGIVSQIIGSAQWDAVLTKNRQLLEQAVGFKPSKDVL